MTTALSSPAINSFAGELALLLLENEANQSECARQERDAARQEFLSNAEQRVSALHQAADATMTGAIVGAAFTVAGGACQLGALETSSDASAKKLGTLSGTLAHLSEPANALLGTSTAGHYQAEATRHEALSEQAKWQAGDASAALDKADRLSDKVLDQVQSIQRDQTAANNALIGRI